MAMLRMIAGGTTLIAAVLLHEAVQAETKQKCALCYGRTGAPLDLEPPEILISGCTAVIQSGDRSGHELAMAFTVRGLGYRRTFLFKLAFEDFNEAINVDPAYAPAYRHRGNMYLERGEIEHAGQAFHQAARLELREAELGDEEL
jgi:tetratricopeptide (TPR) repeat protein